MDADEIERKASKVLHGAAVFALAVRAEVDAEHGEVSHLSLFGLPVFKRTEEGGLPIVLGVTFPRWIRGPRTPPR